MDMQPGDAILIFILIGIVIILDHWRKSEGNDF